MKLNGSFAFLAAHAHELGSDPSPCGACWDCDPASLPPAAAASCVVVPVEDGFGLAYRVYFWCCSYVELLPVLRYPNNSYRCTNYRMIFEQ